MTNEEKKAALLIAGLVCAEIASELSINDDWRYWTDLGYKLLAASKKLGEALS